MLTTFCFVLTRNSGPATPSGCWPFCCCRNSWPQRRRIVVNCKPESEPIWMWTTCHLVHCPQKEASECSGPVGGTDTGWLAEGVHDLASSIVAPGTGDRQPSDPSRSTRPCVPPTRFGPSCDTDPPNSSFLVWRHQTWLTVGTHPEVLMPRVDVHLVQPRC